MFLIAGITPRIIILDHQPRRCPLCGLHQAYFKRIDHYLNLFFLPLFPVKKGEPFIMCDRCEQSIHEMPEIPDGWAEKPYPGKTSCRACGRAVREDFTYCPHCGKHL